MKERVPQDAPASEAPSCSACQRDIEIARTCLNLAAAYLGDPVTTHRLAMALLNTATALDRLLTSDRCEARGDDQGDARRIVFEIAEGVAGMRREGR